MRDSKREEKERVREREREGLTNERERGIDKREREWTDQ